jgi:hypothetical protein
MGVAGRPIYFVIANSVVVYKLLYIVGFIYFHISFTTRIAL